MNYQTFDTCKNLNAFVKCYWALESPKEKETERQRIVPDGCMEMIFHYGDLYQQHFTDGTNIIQPRCFVFGQLTTPLEIEPTGTTGIFAIRFHPAGFLPFATIPIKQLENKATALDELFGAEGLILGDKVLAAKTNIERIQVVESFLLNRLTDAETIDRIVKTSVETILSINGQLSVDELSSHMQVHRKQLERKFATVIGLSPKQLSKIIRLQATIQKLLDKEFTNLTELAYNGEYYDQAHFIKDFKEFTGSTPKNFYSNNLKMTSLFHSKG